MWSYFRRIRLSFSVAVLLISGAAVALGYYSYRSAQLLSATSEDSIARTNRALGLRLITRIEKLIVDTDRTLFELVRLEDPIEFRELWRRIVRVSPAVQSVIVLNHKGRPLHVFDKEGWNAGQKFRALFEKRIIPDLELDRLAPEQHRHLHQYYNGKPYLFSYIGRETEGHNFFILLSISIPYIVTETFTEEFRGLEQSSSIAVLDDMSMAIYGNPIYSASRLVFEQRFPTTLYRWRLQIAPKERQVLEQQARARRLWDLTLVSTAVIVIVAGLIFLTVAARKERIANQLKSDFIANVSHELKTPLSLVRMFGELISLGRPASSEKTKEYASIIVRESDRLTTLIDNVLDFARIERGKAAYDFKLGPIAPVLERVLELCSYRLDKAGVAIEEHIESELPELNFDETAMTLLFLNLVDNALKHGASAGQTIVVRLWSDANTIRFSIQDQGRGIPESEQRRIFERFFRGESARKSTRGAGIGLSLVKHIAEAHSGSVTVTSVVGQGTLFEVTLPLKHPPKE